MLRLLCTCLVLVVIVPLIVPYTTTTGGILPFYYFTGYTPKPKCTPCTCGDRNDKVKIVGGSPSENNEFPWMASLHFNGKFYCGAALITDLHVMTAAHCVKNIPWFMINVKLGSNDRCNVSDNVQSRFIVRVTTGNFSYDNFVQDIAILRLNRRVNITNDVSPVCLPRGPEKSYSGKIAVVAGWGKLNDAGDNTSCELRDVEVPVLSNKECHETTKNDEVLAVDEAMICAGNTTVGLVDSCQGDSGGPLVVERADNRYEVIGIVSWGKYCARPEYPGVYTRITKYLNWIRANTDEGCYCS